jgi:hypothetical protein
VALNLSGVVWGLGRSKAGKTIVYMENIAVLLLNDDNADHLVGKRVMFVCRYSGKGSLFFGYEWLVINDTEG